MYQRSPFRYDTITALCLKDLLERSPRYSKEKIDELLSDPTGFYAISYTRQELEAETNDHIEGSVFRPLRELKNLKTLGLCFAVGEEMEHVDFLFGLTQMKKGLVEFMNPSHWLIRPQDTEDVWNIQYASFINADFMTDKNNNHLPYDVCRTQREVTDIDSRAPGLQEGDKRYVEVEIQRRAGKDSSPKSLYGYRSRIYWNSVFNHNNVGNQTSHEDQVAIPQDMMETIEAVEATEATALAETSEEDISIPALDPESNRIDQSSVLELQRTASPDLQPDSNTDEWDDHSALNPASEEVSSTQSEPQSNRQAEDPLSSRSIVSVTSNAAADTEKDPEILLDSDDEDHQVQTNTEPRDQAPERMISHDDYDFYGDSATEADQTQGTIKEKGKGNIRRRKLRQAFSQKKQPLLDIVVTPSPYTEEEMESHEKWQQQTISGNLKWTTKGFHQTEKPSSPFQKSQEPKVKDSGAVVSQTTTPEDMCPSPASPNRSGLPSKSVKIGGAFVLFLLLVILSLPPESLSNGRQEGKGSYQQ